MKLGVLVDDRQAYFKWQERLLEEISQYENISLEVVINHYVQDRQESMVKYIMMVQEWMEYQILAIKANHRFSKITHSKHLQAIAKINLDQRDATNTINATLARLQSFELELIVDLTCRPVEESLPALARRGIWSMQHSNNRHQLTNWAGLVEMIYGHPVISIKLLEVGPAGQTNVIDESFHYVHWSLARNKAQLIEQASILIGKHLKLETKPFHVRATRLLAECRDPSFGQIIRYLVHFYRSLLTKAYKKLATKHWGRRFRCWSLLVGRGTFISADPSTLQSITPPPGEFWADPFLFVDAAGVYLFFENFSMRSKIGKISCLEVKDHTVSALRDVLVKDFHLSYPFICEEDGSVFMIPEASASQRLEIYRCAEMPDKWELFSTAFEGEPIADASYFQDDAGNRWLFVNKGVDNYFNDQLHIYQIDSLSLGTITPHRQNPVIVDARRARNAGPIFRSGSKFIRPSQNNSFGIYGYGLNLNVIKKLSLDHYEEELLHQVTPESHPRFKSCHHLHQAKEHFVIDAIIAD